MSLKLYFAGMCLDCHVCSRVLDWLGLDFAAYAPFRWTVQLTQSHAPVQPSGRLLCESHGIRVYSEPPGWLFGASDERNPVWLRVSERYDRMRLHLPPAEDAGKQREHFWQLLRTAIEAGFPQWAAISIHASCVERDGSAVVFTAPSGTGKSTHARLWERHLNARLISGDRPAVCTSGRGALAYGMPWDGKEQLNVQVTLPLRAMVEIRKSKVNTLRRLTGAQARRTLLRQCFIPMWDSDAAASALCVIEMLLKAVPVYLLNCTPDSAAPQLVYDALYGGRHDLVMKEVSDMHRKPGFVVRHVLDEYMLMPTGEQVNAFGGTVVLNEMAAFLWEHMANWVCTEELVQTVMAEFDADEPAVRADIEKYVSWLRERGLLEEGSA